MAVLKRNLSTPAMREWRAAIEVAADQGTELTKRLDGISVAATLTVYGASGFTTYRAREIAKWARLHADRLRTVKWREEIAEVFHARYLNIAEKGNLIALLTIHDAAGWSRAGAHEVAAWLDRQAGFIAKKDSRAVLPSRHSVSYRYEAK